MRYLGGFDNGALASPLDPRRISDGQLVRCPFPGSAQRFRSTRTCPGTSDHPRSGLPPSDLSAPDLPLAGLRAHLRPAHIFGRVGSPDEYAWVSPSSAPDSPLPAGDRSFSVSCLYRTLLERSVLALQLLLVGELRPVL